MEIACRIRRAVVALTLLVLFALPNGSRGQETERLGTVLVVEQIAKALPKGTPDDEPEWERLKQLHFRDGILDQDTARTFEDSKLKVLLRDDSLVTLGEKSRMEFTASLVSKQDPPILTLLVGKIRALTTGLLPGSAREVRTPNAVAGVRGSEALVLYDPTPPGKTTVLCVNGECFIQDLKESTKVLTMAAGTISEKIGDAPPTRPRPATPQERQEIAQATDVPPSQVPWETQTIDEQKRDPLPDTPRGGGPPVPSPDPPRDPGVAPEPVDNVLDDPARQARLEGSPQETTIQDASESPALEGVIEPPTEVDLTIIIPR